ncbi:Acyl-CoA binding domain containing 5 [Terramyces sp. JEL0728]|nr:Acyl-CoA binding domain containing 5 [Terramyces sp. JEL0728]
MSNNEELVNDLFDHACDALKQLTSLTPFPSHWPTIPISNRLLTYAYFKQATKGDCKQAQPPWWDSIKRYKWNAWKKLANKSLREAKIGYIRITIDILTPFLSIPEKKSENIEENIKFLQKIDEIDYVKLKTPVVVYERDLNVKNENR